MIFGKSLIRLTDEEIIVRLQKGEGRALDELYRRYGPLLLRYFHRMLWQDQFIAEDAVHDVFVKLMENGWRVDAERKFSTWIYSVAFDHCKNLYRRRAFRVSVESHSKPEAIFLPSEGNALDRLAFQRRLEELLDEEGEELRSMLVMRHELEMPFAEIGAALNCPEGTVKSKLFYLKKRLALSLEPFKVILEK